MNKSQKEIYEFIRSSVKLDIDLNSAWFLYNMRNTIAKYSLYDDMHYITQKTLNYLKANNILREDNKLRRRLKGRKNRFTLEHNVPSSVVLKMIYDVRYDDKKIKEILEKTSVVTVLTYDEDKLIRDSGYQSKMPEGWKLGDDVFARYRKSGVEVPTKMIEVYGAVYR